jgi:glycosyltransferase involved in cell wall biosynthesis
MKVCGFTIIRNGVKFDYPIVESIQSILPVCDHFIVAVGDSDDDTLQLIRNINSPKIEILETVWDLTLRKGGRTLAIETDKAFQAIPETYDWAFYLQADEIVHENSLPAIRQAMEANLGDERVEGLLFNYYHFYGSYEYVGQAYSWCRREIRVIRNRKDIFSYRDALGFRKKPNDKLRVKLTDAYVYHYSWVKSPVAQQKKLESFRKLWHDDEWIEKSVMKAEEFDYGDSEELGLFKGTHPLIMMDRISRQDWTYTSDLSRASVKFRFKSFVERLTGWRVGEYRNYKLIKG